MKKLDCNFCDEKNIPMNDTIKIDGKVYCGKCFELYFSDEKNLEGKLVEKEIDPTVCSSCHSDFGAIELNKISTYPVCDKCEVEIKNRTFPTWVKGFFAGILIIVLVSFFWNWKYYKAYNDIKKSNDYFLNKDYAKASVLMKNASNNVPEVEELNTLSSYFHGIELLVKEKSSEALAEFNKCKDKLPPEYDLNTLIIQATIGSTFDNKDYKGFLGASKENLELDSTLPASLTSVASAYACIYAENGDISAKQNAFLYLNKAKAIDSSSTEMKTYYNLVEYRLETRKIIKREEFIKQYPNGWTKN